MVEQGELTATEAASLLSAMSQVKNKVSAQQPRESYPATGEQAPQSAETGSETVNLDSQKPAGKSPQWFRVRVTDLASGRVKVIVNLPIGLVNWGMKIGARYAPEVSDFDFNELSEMLQSGAGGKMVDVMDEEDGEHVEVFID
jgi:hypothetical protein